MNAERFYYLGSTALNIRESFNNTIILMTMVKSDYYIIGFSRPKNQIVVGFDHVSPIECVVTEAVTLSFEQSGEFVIRCELKNADAENEAVLLLCRDRHGFSITASENKKSVVYSNTIMTDSLIPLSMDMIDEYILTAKKMVCDFLDDYCILSTKIRQIQ